MVSSIVAAGLFLLLGVLVLSGRPLSGTADDPASLNCQLLFAIAVFLDCVRQFIPSLRTVSHGFQAQSHITRAV